MSDLRRLTVNAELQNDLMIEHEKVVSLELQNKTLMKTLVSIHSILPPKDITVDGITHTFSPKDPELVLYAWKSLANQIRAIPEKLEEAIRK